MNEEKADSRRLDNNWLKVLFQVHLHLGAIYGVYLLFAEALWSTVFFFMFLVMFGTLGLTLGCHRLWAHKTFTATWPVRLMLIAGQTLVCDGSALKWAWWHRLHHEHHGTYLDPYDYKRGFFFSQYASRCLVDNPDQERARKHLPTGDLEDDNVVYYQDLLYWLIMPVFGIILPINACMEYWGESIWVAIFVIGVLRIVVLLNMSWLIHSGYIIWGLDPLDKRSSDTWLVFFFNKSLWPQYHYLLPWDYRSGEFGTYDEGCSTAILRVLAALRLATNLTTITNTGVRAAMGVAAETGRPLVKCLEESKLVITDIFNQDQVNSG